MPVLSLVWGWWVVDCGWDKPGNGGAIVDKVETIAKCAFYGFNL